MSDSTISSVRGYLITPVSRTFVNWYCYSKTWSVNKYVTSRLGTALLAGPELATQVIDTLIGTGAAVLNLITAGKSITLAKRTCFHLEFSGNQIISIAYKNLIRIINPFSPLFTQGSSSNRLITNVVIDNFNEAGRWCRNYHNPIVRHVGSRLCYLVGLVASLVSRVVDFAIGVIAAIFSIFPCFGKCETLNNVAFRGLQVTGIVSDIFYFLTKAVNPWAINTK